MKLLAGSILFLLCALTGEGKARRLLRREQALSRFHGLIHSIGDRQLLGLSSFQEAALACPPSPEREQLLMLLADPKRRIPLLTEEETIVLAAYARSDCRSVAALQKERDDLLALLDRERERMREERAGKGQVYRSVGYLCGAAALLLVL